MMEAEQQSQYPATGAERNGVSPPTATADIGKSSGSSAGVTAVKKEEKAASAVEGEETKRRQEDEAEELVIEQPLLTIKEVFVYRVPPLRASSGHRAEEWGLANPVFTGVLKMAQVGNACCLRLFKPPPEGELGAVPELFAECEVRLDNGRTLQVYVESVIDSSRYFVLRCEDKASGRHAYVGVGFRERSSAFDFKAVLDDFVRFLDRQKRAEETSAIIERQEDGSGEDALGPVKAMRDLSIAEGQKVHIALKVGSNGGSTGGGGGGSRARRRPRSDAGSKAAPQGGNGGLLLAPPPLPGVTYKGGLLSAPPPPPPVSPQAASTPEIRVEGAPAAVTAGVAPPTVTSPADEPPDLSNGTASSSSSSCEVGEGSAVRVGESGGGGVGDDDDDDDGWGEFESA